MRHTLKEFEEHYSPKKIQLIIGDHLISIDTELEGSAFIMRYFSKATFYFVRFEDDFLLLNIIEE